MNAARLSRLGQKWLALVVGVQVVLWTMSGFYMVVVDLDFIHGDPLVRNLAPVLDLRRPVAPLDSLRASRSDITAIHLRALPREVAPVHEIAAGAGSELVDAQTGRRTSPLSPP